MDDKPQPPPDFFDRLQQEVEGAEEDVVCKLELKFDPNGAPVSVPTLNPLRRDEPVYEQLIEHLRREGCGPGKYRIRLRVGGVIGPQKVEAVQFAPAVAPPVAPQVAARAQPAAPASSPAREANPFAQVAETFKSFRRARDEFEELLPEEPEDDDDLEEEEDDEPEEEEAQAPGWLDEVKKDAAKQIVPLGVSVVEALVDLTKAFAKKLGGGELTLSGSEKQRPAPAASPSVELVRDDDERAAS